MVEVLAPLAGIVLTLHHRKVGELPPAHTEAGVTQRLALGAAEPVSLGVVRIQHHALRVEVLPVLAGWVGALDQRGSLYV